MVKLFIVIPCYNESEVLGETSKRLYEKMNNLLLKGVISSDSRVIFVDDGSKDDTWEKISALHNENDIFSGCKLSRNRGHQNALLAGLSLAKGNCDAVISMDADLQDDINAIDEFIAQYEAGYEVVYGVRKKRKKDSFFKRFTAESFYKFMKFMGAEIVFNHADYRLLGSKALDGLFEFEEVNLFLRGLVPLVGFNSTEVYYERNERFAGESKYPLKKMLSFAFDGITSLSIKPVKLIINVGIFCFVASIAMLIYALISHFTGHTVSGWTSIMASIWALGGLQLLAIGIVGEYVGKVFLETKKRPRFIIEKFLNKE
ncbi:MAG: glycosyltransferase family 2 protein [Clostridia bacterium]|nr:glycosyltransferase family 2 protein [Clostridia bacterium]